MHKGICIYEIIIHYITSWIKTTISGNADGLHDNASCKIYHSAMHAKCNHQATRGF